MKAEYDKFQEKGVVEDMIFLGIGVVVIGVVVMVGVNIMVSTEANVDLTGLDATAAADANEAVQGTFALVNDTVTNYGIVVIAVLGALSIGAIMGYLSFLRGGNRTGGGSM